MTAVLERLARVEAPFATEPYEVPWAAQANFFVHTLDIAGDQPRLEFRTQISPDGLNWCNHDQQTHQVSQPGLTSWTVDGFGQWLRLQCTPVGQNTIATVRIYLVGKS